MYIYICYIYIHIIYMYIIYIYILYKASIKGPCSIAILNNQRVHVECQEPLACVLHSLEHGTVEHGRTWQHVAAAPQDRLCSNHQKNRKVWNLEIWGNYILELPGFTLFGIFFGCTYMNVGQDHWKKRCRGQRGQQWQLALEFFQQMPSSQLLPDVISYLGSQLHLVDERFCAAF